MGFDHFYQGVFYWLLLIIFMAHKSLFLYLNLGSGETTLHLFTLLFAFGTFMSTKTDSINHVNLLQFPVEFTELEWL